MPEVSVIIPNYNHAPYLEERINSVLAQTCQDFELIILDDCSTDGSREVIETFRNHPKISHIIFNKQNSGSTFHQWNKGMTLAKGQFIWIAESDDIADPTLLQALLPAFKDSYTAISYCQSYEMNEKGNEGETWLSHTAGIDPDGIFERAFTMPGNHFLEKFLLFRNVIPNASACIFKKEAYLKMGGAVDKFKVVGDWYVWIRLALEGSVSFCPAALNGFRKHGTSVIAKVRAQNAQKPTLLYGYEMRKLLQRLFATHPNSALHTINKAMMQQEHDDIGWRYYHEKALGKAAPYYFRRLIRKVLKK